MKFSSSVEAPHSRVLTDENRMMLSDNCSLVLKWYSAKEHNLALGKHFAWMQGWGWEIWPIWQKAQRLYYEYRAEENLAE